MRDTLQRLARECADAGFDLCEAAAVGAYNARLQGRDDFVLPELGDPAHAVIVVGNTRALWPRFIAALGADPALRAVAHPLDSYSRARIEQAAAHAARELGVAHEVRHAADPPPRAVALQQLAEVTGLAQTAPCRLSVHAGHGPWIALRAAVVLAAPAPPRERAPARPCDACQHRPCLPAFEHARSADAGLVHLHGKARVAENHARWLAVRDACPVGRASRYGRQQLDYHYLKDRDALLRSLPGPWR